MSIFPVVFGQDVQEDGQTDQWDTRQDVGQGYVHHHACGLTPALGASCEGWYHIMEIIVMIINVITIILVVIRIGITMTLMMKIIMAILLKQYQL